MHIKIHKANSLSEIIEIVSNITLDTEKHVLYFRGAHNDHGDRALEPFVYRKKEDLGREHIIYREMQRFNDHEFTVDKTAFDKLARMQHYSSPTRLLDISEDILSACYFALEEDNENRVVYILKIDKEKIKYYDSDSVSILSNLAKTPLENKQKEKKSKKAIWELANDYYDDRKGFKKLKDSAIQYLIHDIKEEKSYFTNLINPRDFFSIFCVKPKYTNQRIHGQKGAFLLFGMNEYDYRKPVEVIKSNKIVLDEKLHPIVEIHKIKLSPDMKLADLEKLGISKPYIYPDLEKVSEYLRR